jgi:two-component system response regulator HydG
MYVILMTGFYSVDSAIEAIKRGAYDYICKPVDFTRLANTLDELADLFTHKSQIRDLEERLLTNLQFHGVVGRSAAMLEGLDLAKKISRHYTNVLISGPTGSGKEWVARALHQMSPVAQERFAVRNCSVLVDTLLESQLFGHMRGLLRERTKHGQASSNMPMAALSFWMKWGKCLWPCKPSCCALCRTGRSSVSGRPR